MSSCLDNVMNLTNPMDLVVQVALPAAAGAAASKFVGTYQPNPNVAPRSFRPLTAAIYCGAFSLFTKLTFDGGCRVSQYFSIRDTFEVFGSATALLALGAGVCVGVTRHIIARDLTATITGETVDFPNATKISFFSSLFF